MAVRIAVEAHPGASLERVELAAATLRVWVRARAVEGKANVAIEQAIASALGLRSREVRLAGGMSSRRKIVDVDLADLEAVRARLLQHGFTVE